MLALGQSPVDPDHDLELGGQVIQSGLGTERHDVGFAGRGRLRGRLGGIWSAEAADDVLDGTEILLEDDLGLAVDPLALAQVVVGMAPDDLLRQARH